MTEKIEAKVSHRFMEPAERVYDSWLDSGKVRVWLGSALQMMGLSGELSQIEIDPKVGGVFLFADMREGVETKHWGTYLELERPHKLVFTWITDPSEESDPSKVTMTIETDGEGSVATLVHEMDAKWSEYVAQTEIGWSGMLQSTEASLEH